MKDLKEHAFLGFMWRGGYNILHQAAAFIVKIILVKILLPSDFGLIAMALIVFTSLDIINKLATGEPFIRDRESDSQQAKNTLFYLNLFFVGSAALAGFLTAPYVAQFFSSKIPNTQSIFTLVWIIRVFSLRLLLSIVSNVPLAVLWKDLKFNKLYFSNMAGTLAYFIITPLCALLGLGIWAIVFGHFIQQLVVSFFYFYFSPFFPKFLFSLDIAKGYLKYNSNIFINSIVMIIITNGDDTLIGRMLGPVLLGYYSIGQQFAMLTELIILRNTNEIMFPIFSRIQDEKERFRRVFFRAYRLTNAIALPLIGGSVVLAKDLVQLIFGEKWLPLLPFFYVLSVSVTLNSFVLLAGPVFKSLNKPHLIRNALLLKLFVFSAAIYPFARIWGAVGVCWVLVLLSLVQLLYLSRRLANEVDGFYKKALNILIKIFPVTLFMMGTVHLLRTLLPLSFLSLLFVVFSGILLYSILMLFGDRELKYDISEGFDIIKKKFKPLSSERPKA